MAKIIISGIIGYHVTAEDIRNQFDDIEPMEDVEVEISSAGGFVFQGLEIFNLT